MHATEQGLSGDTPGRVYVGSCSDAVQWAVCNAAYVINASERGDFEWHEYCVHFRMNRNYKHALDGVTWMQRSSNVLWLALTALALGENVLTHCHRASANLVVWQRCLGPFWLRQAQRT